MAHAVCFPSSTTYTVWPAPTPEPPTVEVDEPIPECPEVEGLFPVLPEPTPVVFDPVPLVLDPVFEVSDEPLSIRLVSFQFYNASIRSTYVYVLFPPTVLLPSRSESTLALVSIGDS